ncbi:hypothetical protein ACFSHT_22220 [Paraburkholderia silviterrae]|uniref:RecT family protein n=1 Tax=Paraburkholderia silviterrae TaxID=2528715 RepID=A0A4R5MG91_9BURK|nr:hypothetical protein [Paraburkholderia silviterrae]TDG25896.1 hypothetical protein EYW47_00560 [Paraburkholderia silviterrae]
MNAPQAARTLADVAQKPVSGVGVSDITVSMFSAQGFALAQRIATAFASSDAVPAQFRAYNLKRGANNVEEWVENPAAIGNCLVAIEVAQAVGMSVTAVMQNADIIEGKLRWSGKFVIAAINASRRFTPLRFDIQNFGMIKATYKEKGAWNKELKRYNMTEKEVQVENLQCIAWAIPAGVPMPAGVYTLAQARTAGLPVIESAPVSIRMAVEEGWYAKSGSKWQTEMKHLMLQYRAGTFFGNIHAPDIVMGMGRTSEEERDVVDLTPQPDGSYAVDLEKLRQNGNATPSETHPETPKADVTDVNAKETPKTDDKPDEGADKSTQQTQQQSTGPLNEAQLIERIKSVASMNELEGLRASIDEIPDPDSETRVLAVFVEMQQKFSRANQRASRGNRPSAE